MLTDPLPTSVPVVRWENFAPGPSTPQENPPTIKTFRRGMLDLRIEYGHTRLRHSEMSHLRSGGVIPLENTADMPVDIYADGELIARGEVIEVEGKVGVRVVELVS